MSLWHEGPQRQVDLVEQLGSDAPTIARTIARLEKAGLVCRKRSATDRRAMIVEATDESLPLREEVHAAWAELELLTVGDMAPAHITHIIDVLADLEENLRRSSS